MALKLPTKTGHNHGALLRTRKYNIFPTKLLDVGGTIESPRVGKVKFFVCTSLKTIINRNYTVWCSEDELSTAIKSNEC